MEESCLFAHLSYLALDKRMVQIFSKNLQSAVYQGPLSLTLGVQLARNPSTTLPVALTPGRALFHPFPFPLHTLPLPFISLLFSFFSSPPQQSGLEPLAALLLPKQ